MFPFRASVRSGAVAGLLLTIGLVMAGCAGGGDGSTDSGDAGACPGTGATATVTDGEVSICAEDLEFDATTIEAPAGEAFTIAFTNAESQPHNVAVYVEEDGEEIFIGDIITGPDVTEELPIPALDAGTYYFRCDVHPDMEGTIVVGG